MRTLFIVHVVERVFAIGHRPTAGDHPAIEILGILEANGDETAITIVTTRIASNDGTTDSVGQGKSGLLAAAPRCAVGPSAFLPAFRRVDAVKPDALAVDFDRVAVDNRCSSCNPGFPR